MDVSSDFISEAIKNSILYNFEQIDLIELATKSLYLFSKISWVKEFGTLILIVSFEIDIGSQLFIQVLKLTSLTTIYVFVSATHVLNCEVILSRHNCLHSDFPETLLSFLLCG